MFKKFADYTTMPVGKFTKHGLVTICERCGKPGARLKAYIPQGSIEKWTHNVRYNIFTNDGPETSCRHIVTTQDGQTTDGWCWSNYEPFEIVFSGGHKPQNVIRTEKME